MASGSRHARYFSTGEGPRQIETGMLDVDVGMGSPPDRSGVSDPDLCAKYYQDRWNTSQGITVRASSSRRCWEWALVVATEGSATGPLTPSVKKKGSLQVFFAAAQQAQIVRSTGQYIDAESKKIRGLAAGPKIGSDMVCGTDDVAWQHVAAGQARYTVPGRASPPYLQPLGAAGRQRIVERRTAKRHPGEHKAFARAFSHLAAGAGSPEPGKIGRILPSTK